MVLQTMIKTKKIDICDFHAHILPNADHGSSSVQNSVFQLSMAGKCGVSRIVATPHFYPHKESVCDFVKRRNESYKELLKAQFIYEKKMNVSKEQKIEWLDKFYRRMSFALYKSYIMPPSVVSWYDNEMGYSTRLAETTKMVASKL